MGAWLVEKSYPPGRGLPEEERGKEFIKIARNYVDGEYQRGVDFETTCREKIGSWRKQQVARGRSWKKR